MKKIYALYLQLQRDRKYKDTRRKTMYIDRC